jgi:hypothetical protein
VDYLILGHLFSFELVFHLFSLRQPFLQP